jgi:ADP-heptose:LPS heptosyltransferase
MAAALRVPFVGLYGPTRFDETRPFPPDPVGAVLRRSLPCQPCYGTPNQRRCRNNLCMQQIEAREVVEKAIQVNPAIFLS